MHVSDEADLVLVRGEEITDCASLWLGERLRASVALATDVGAVVVELSRCEADLVLAVGDVEVDRPVAV